MEITTQDILYLEGLIKDGGNKDMDYYAHLFALYKALEKANLLSDAANHVKETLCSIMILAIGRKYSGFSKRVAFWSHKYKFLSIMTGRCSYLQNISHLDTETRINGG